MSDLSLSVVMPAFNGERYIRAALESVVSEPGAGRVECVVVDDGSSDRTADIARSFEGRIEIEVVPSGGAGNWVAATNVGLARARADLACFLHQDDLWLPGRLESISRLVADHPEAALWVQGAVFVDDDGREVGRWRLPVDDDGGELASADFVERLLVQNSVCIAAPVFRREDVLTSGGLDEKLWYTADWDLWLRLGSRGPVGYDARPGVAFRVHGASQTATKTHDAEEMRRQLEVVVDRHFPSWSAAVGAERSGRLRRIAAVAVSVNVGLASALHGRRRALVAAIAAVVGLGPRGARQLLRNSRLRDRVMARLRVSLHR